MSSAVIRNGHWRRRDPLKGLSDTMLSTLVLAETQGLFMLRDGVWASSFSDDPKFNVNVNLVKRATVETLADRGLLRLSCGPHGARRDYLITSEGRAIVAELRRREAARAKLIAERPARATL